MFGYVFMNFIILGYNILWVVCLVEEIWMVLDGLFFSVFSELSLFLMFCSFGEIDV